MPAELDPEEYMLESLPPTAPVLAELSSPLATFLLEAGMPPCAAPFLSFHLSRHGLCRIWELYGQPHEWSREDRDRLNPFLMIGADSAGNPICIDLSASERVVLLDHEDCFRTLTFINSGLSHLAECLLARRLLRSGADLESAVRAADPAALTPGSFWVAEVVAGDK